MKRERHYFIDLLKSIAIMGVLAYHGSNYSFNILNNQSVMDYIHYFYRANLSICVPLFFMVNGFLLFNHEFNLKKHLYKCFYFILLTEVWAIIDLFILMYVKNDFLSMREFIMGVWTCKQGWINHLWYMQALIVIYTLFPLLKVVYDYKKNILYFFTVVTFIFTFGNKALNIFITIVMHIIKGYDYIIAENWFNGFNIFRNLYGYTFVYFCLGGLWSDYFKHLNRILNNIWSYIGIWMFSTTGLFVLGIYLSSIQGEMWDIVWSGYDTFFTLVNVICIFSIFVRYRAKNNLINRCLEIIAQNTLGVYFIHVIFNQLLLPEISEINMLSNFVGNVVYAMLLLTISLVTVEVLRKIPILGRWLVGN